MANAEEPTTGAAGEAEGGNDPVEGARRPRRPSGAGRGMIRQAEDLARDGARTAREVLDGTIPQRVASRGLHLVKERAQRHDRVGDATYRALELVHGGLGSATEALGKLREAAQPPAREGSRPVGPGARRGQPRPPSRRTPTV